MLIVAVWWLWMQLMGLAALPLAYRAFRRLPDRGYAFARPLGLLLVSYGLWLGGSLGFLRNSVGGALFCLVAVAVLSAAVYRRGREESDPGLLAWLRGHGRLVLTVELLFAGALGLWALLRAYSPEIMTAGGEKFMELMYLNSIARSEFFPPHDAWLSGYGISYYYFGYVMMATLTRLSGFAAHQTFNVGLASLFALTCTGAFGLVYNLVRGAERETRFLGENGFLGKSIGFGFLGAILVAVLGNLEGFLEVLYSLRVLPQGFWRWLDILDLNEPFSGGPSLIPARSGWWWWRASRVLNDLDPAGDSMGLQPIDEFPGFSFLLGDMHPHVLALPFVLLALALALNQLRQGAASDEGGDWLEPVKRLSPLAPLCIGALGFLNTWDFPIYLLVFVAAYGLAQWGRYGRWNWPFLRDVGVTGATVALAGFLLYLPFYVGFQSQAGGLLPTLYVGTRFRHYFVMFGPFLAALAGLLLVLTRRLQREQPGAQLLKGWLGWTAALVLLPLAVMFLIVLVLVLAPQGRDLLEGIRRVPAVYEIVGDDSWPVIAGKLLLVKLRYWVMPLVAAGLAALGLVLLKVSRLPHPRPLSPRGGGARGEGETGSPSLQFTLLCAVTGLLLTLSVEYLYLVDNFRVRMNTIFKFYFQGWVLMALASAFAVYWLSRQKGGLRRIFLVAFWLLLAMGLVYPVLGNYSRAGEFQPEPTLDGTAYLATSQPDDYAAIQWLNENVKGTPIILERPGSGGKSYVYEGRVSALTGLPTLLGWAGHEGQWRGDYTVQSARDPDIETIYDTFDVQVAQVLLAQYDVTYVYVGPLERSTYDPRGLDKFERFMDVVYRNPGVTIYKMRK